MKSSASIFPSLKTKITTKFSREQKLIHTSLYSACANVLCGNQCSFCQVLGGTGGGGGGDSTGEVRDAVTRRDNDLPQRPTASLQEEAQGTEVSECPDERGHDCSGNQSKCGLRVGRQRKVGRDGTSQAILEMRPTPGVLTGEHELCLTSVLLLGVTPRVKPGAN